MVACKLNRWRKWSVSLDENFAGCLAAASASGHLRKKLKRAFACAEIREVQGEIGVDNTDERYIREMQAFRDHLCADENIDLACAKIPQRFTIRFLARHRIGVHSAHHRFWENLGDACFHFLSAEAVVNQRVLSTGGTFLWNSGGVPAQMTAQSARCRLAAARS